MITKNIKNVCATAVTLLDRKTMMSQYAIDSLTRSVFCFQLKTCFHRFFSKEKIHEMYKTM